MNTSAEPASGSLAGVFATCRKENRAALIPYVTAGHPRAEVALDVLLALADGGADIIELGVPFSDPLADGPTIQQSSHLALANSVTLPWVLQLLERFRGVRTTPVVIFSYLNPILSYGPEAFLSDAAEAGAAGVLLTDLPVGADDALERLFASSSLDLIRLIAPTTGRDRLREIVAGARGFLYYISRTGVTGGVQELARGLQTEVQEIRRVTDLPVAVGFGIASPEQAATVARYADGVVVGSALVERLDRGGVEAGGDFVRRLSRAMRTAR